MLPIPPRRELLRRLPPLVLGLILFGAGIAIVVISNLGLSPWNVFHQGVSMRLGIPMGTVVILTGIAVLLLWIPLKQRIGLGTVLNVLVIGTVVDLTLWITPERVEQVWLEWVLMLGGTLMIGIGSGLYIGAGLGPGPRDGLMTGLAERGIPVGLARGIIEVTALIVGWVLGGTVGVGTVVFAIGIGPIVAFFLEHFNMDPEAPDERRVQETRKSR